MSDFFGAGVSDFFGPLPELPEPQVHRQPEWMGPRDNEVGVAVSLQFVLARAADVAIAVSRGAAYSNGFKFRLTVHLRTRKEDLFDPFGQHPRRRRNVDEVLRFGLQLADGAKATTLGIWPPSQEEVARPRLTQRGGQGGGTTWRNDFWLWPLPPPGPIVFACEWPSESIPLTTHEIDAQPILDAAARVETLWPDGDGSSEGGSWTSYERFSSG